jgi:ParB family transcriptional regulator, chromosome partitioning protein
MKGALIEIRVDQVVVGKALRDHAGDLATLENSIRRLGLLPPIAIDRRNVLGAGGRGLQACRNAGLRVVPALRFSVEAGSAASLEIQADENLCRQDLTHEEIERHIERKKAHLAARASGLWRLWNRIRGWWGRGERQVQRD